MITNEKLESHYDSVYRNGQDTYFTFSSYNQAKEILDRVRCWEGKRVLEIGCGEGALAAMIGYAGATQVDAIDYSSEAIDIANEKVKLDNVQFACKHLNDIEDQYDVVVMLGVLEHIDQPFETLNTIMDRNVSEKGIILTSSPSFLNPRGYIWMTLQILFDVPMSLSDIHFFSPTDFKDYAKEHGYGLEVRSTDFDWGAGKRTLVDMEKRLTNALLDAGLDNSKVPQLIAWLEKAVPYFENNSCTGANIVYKIWRE